MTRTGKTRTNVYELALWINKQYVRRALVVAPATGCSVWLQRDELGMFDPTEVNVVDLSDGSLAERREVIYGLLHSELPTIGVINRDVIFKERPAKNGKLTGLQKALQAWGPDALTLDECHDYRTPSSRRSLAALALAKRAKFRRGMSGTPDPRNYMDYYGQFKIVAPEVFGTRKDEFQERYCIMDRFYPHKVDRYINTAELREKILSRASIVTQSECFDMPEVLPDIFVPVPFTRYARELYEEIRRNKVAEVMGDEIDATHQLARLAILHQLAQGFYRNDAGEIQWVFDGKIRAALEYAAEMIRAGKKLVIFHHYRPEGERLYEQLCRRYGASRVAALNGDTPRSGRSARPFFDNTALQILVAQEETAQMSISLREADHVLWYSYGPDWDVDYQARQRIFDERKNKPHGLSYTFLEVPHTADRFMYKTAQDKKTDSEALRDIGLYRAISGDV